MLKNERHIAIINALRKKKSMEVTELAKALFVSEATVRRDLAELSKSGALIRSHGGAFLPEGGGVESPGAIRERQNVREKRLMAELVRDFLRAEMTVFMDSSSSAGAVIPYLNNVTVVTNGISNCERLINNRDVKVYIASGAVSRYSNAAIGSDTVKCIDGFFADLCIISCGGISKNGVSEASLEQAEIKRHMLKNSDVKILLCDSGKFSKDCMCKLCDYSVFDYLITDTLPPSDILSEIKQSGCEIINVK